MTSVIQARQIALKPREARVIVTRILRQADWGWGLEPAVGTVVLASHLAGFHGLDMLDREWDAICASRPEAILAVTDRLGVNRLDCGSCHAFVAAPTILDYLVRDVAARRRSVIEIRQCASPALLAALATFGPCYAMTVEVEDGHGCTIISGLDDGGRAERCASSELSASDYRVDIALWERLRARAFAYLVPESDISRSHAGDGTLAFPMSAETIIES